MSAKIFDVFMQNPSWMHETEPKFKILQ